MLYTKDLVTIREARQQDKNFVMATILRGLYYGESVFKDVPKDVFMANYHAILEKLLSHPNTKVTVACLKDDEDVILGYSVSRVAANVSVLDYVFVKAAWRKIGIGKSLVPKDTSFITHLTKVGRSIWKEKMPTVKFNPFLL